MTLKEYLKKRKITYKKFALMGGWNITTVFFWVSGRRIPSIENAIRIEALTSGKVKAQEIRTPVPIK
jgi:DNA-binding transcriptional regulator YdaS (Cro superfamily)